MTAHLDAAAARRMRVVSSGLLDPAPTATDAVRRLGAVQAQDVVAPLVAVALRTAGADRAAVDAAFAAGALVRSWVFRGTLHIVAADDLAIMVTVGGARSVQGGRAVRAALGLTDAQLAAARDALLPALGGEGLRRPDALAAIAAAGVDVSGARGYHLLILLAAAGDVHVGARIDGQYRIHAASVAPIDRDEALGDVAVRYLRGHGPATAADLAWWCGITLTEARSALALAGDRVESVDVDGVAHWIEAGSVPAPATLQRAADSVLAVPGFDESYLGYADRGLAIDRADQPRLAPTSNGRFLPVIVADGRIVATWRPQDDPMVEFFRDAPPGAVAAAQRAASRTAALFG